MAHGEKTTQSKQWAASMTAAMLLFCAGSVMGWATTTLPRLMDDDSPNPLTSDQSSWTVSCTNIGTAMGHIIGTVCGHYFGRKSTMILCGFVYIVGFVITIIATGVSVLYVARSILGLGMGVTYVICPVYISELVDVNIRGAAGSMGVMNITIGMIFTCVVGPFVTTKELTIVLLLIPILFIIGFVWFPETPCYLASKDKLEEAARSLGFFRGITKIENAREDLKIMIWDMNQEVEQSTWRKKLQELCLPSNRKGLAISIYLFLTEVFTGNAVIEAYLSVFFQKINIAINPDFGSAIVLFANLLSCGASALFIERVGRRPLLLISCLGTSAALVTLATFLYLHDNNVDLQFLNWLPMVLIIMFQMFYQIGIGSIRTVLIGEFFSTSVKGTAFAVTMVLSSAVSSILIKLNQIVGDALGYYVTYYFFALSTFIAFVFILFFVPETKNRTVREIQQDLAEIRLTCCRKGQDSNTHDKVDPRV